MKIYQLIGDSLFGILAIEAKLREIAVVIDIWHRRLVL